jgi:hypothetical protein
MEWSYQGNEIRKDNKKRKMGRHISPEYMTNEKKDLNLYLFFDLLQLSRDIINISTPQSVFILVGESPSYLLPFLADHRMTYLLQFSNKPYLLYSYPHAEMTGMDCIDTVTPHNDAIKILEQYTSSDSSLPSVITTHDATLTENYYFEYLDTKTIITREFVKNRWNDLVLIDHSAGPSIAGASIFFNRYIGNIKSETICDIEGSMPMKFINLRNKPYTNIPSKLSKSIFKNSNADNPEFYNYEPNLIIVLASCTFLHFYDFLVYESFPRVTGHYPSSAWKSPPYIYEAGSNALDIFHTLLKNFIIFTEYDKNNNPNDQVVDTLIDILNHLSYTKEYLEKYEGSKVSKLLRFFRKVNNDVLITKYNNIYELTELEDK